MFLKGIEDLRSVRWGASYCWDVRFLGAPRPFDKWFPASEVTVNVATIKSHTFEAANTSFAFPIGTSAADLNITFYDDEDHTLLNWFTAWMNGVIVAQAESGGTLKESKGTQQLVTSIQEIEVVKLNRQREIADHGVQFNGNMYQISSSSTYKVYPTEAINFKGNSQSGIEQYSVSFQIVGS